MPNFAFFKGLDDAQISQKQKAYSHSNVLFDYHVFWASDSHFHALLSHLSQWSQ